MYAYESTDTITINTTNEYHAVIGLSQGAVNGAATFLAGDTGSITDTADNGGVLRCTSAAHGLISGQPVTLNGMGDAAHNGVTVVTVIDENIFDCDDIAYNSDDDTGEWQRGDTLRINEGYGGIYTGGFSLTGSSAVASKDFKVEVYADSTPFDEFAGEALFNNTGYNQISSGGVGVLQAGQYIWLGIENTTDAQDFVLRHGNLHLVLN